MKYVFFPETRIKCPTWAGIETGRIWDGTYLGGHVMPKPAADALQSHPGRTIWAPNIDCACGWVPTLGDT